MGIKHSIGRWINRAMGIESMTLSEMSEHIERGGGTSKTGVYVNENNATKYTPFFAGISLIGNYVGVIPCHIYERLDDGDKERDTQYDYLLNVEPNPLMSAFDFRKLLIQEAIISGNGIAQIERDEMGEPVAFWPIPSVNVKVEVQAFDIDGQTIKTLIYTVKVNEQQAYKLLADDVIHIMAFTRNGYEGIPLVRHFRDSIELGKACEEFGMKVFTGAMPTGAWKLAGKVSEDQLKRMRTELEHRYSGIQNAFKIMLIEGGIDYIPFGKMSAEDAQYLATRNFQIGDIARILSVPTYMLQGELSTVTYSNAEQNKMEFLSNGLIPWLKRFELEYSRKLIPFADRQRKYAEHLVDAVLRPDSMTRAQVYAIGRQWGWLSINDIRRKENMRPITEGDSYQVNPVGTTVPPQEQAPKAQQDRGQVKLAFRDMLADVAGRIIRRELGQAKAGKLDPAEQRQFMREALGFACRAYVAALGQDASQAQQQLTQFVETFQFRGIGDGAISEQAYIDSFVTDILALWGND